MKENIIKVNDLLGIHVSSKSRNQEQAALFNMASDSVGYQVTNAGTIDVPVLGYVKVAGLTKVQLQTLLTEKLSPYVKDPLVIVRFNQFNVNVLGEVRSPGTKTFGTDKVSIIDAISESGDMTDFGKKEKVVVIREENGKRNYYSLDLRSGAVFQSPAYFLQPNDIVYVEPNDFRLKTLAIDPNKQTNRSNLQFFISLGLTFAALAVTLIRLK
jgi:polysaccharide export outer membrane protein